MWPLSVNDIKRLQIEITSFCNAACPSCERANYTFEDDYVYRKKINSRHITFNQFKKWFQFSEFKNLIRIHLCGNIEEPTLNPDIIQICRWINDNTDEKTWIYMSTNGGTHNETFWSELATIKNLLVIFGIDGLEDTNHIYRKNIRWKKLSKNFRVFIKNGGKAAWQFIVFEHNKHQLKQAKQISIDEGFVSFNEVYSSRENFEVKEIVKETEKNSCVKCKATYFNYDLEESFFVDVMGNVWPCCWMGTNLNSNKIAKNMPANLGYFLSHNLNHDTFKNIVEGDFFTYLWDNLSKFEVCNHKCKDNVIDTFEWNLLRQWS